MRRILPVLSGKDYLRLLASALITLEFLMLYNVIRAYPTLHGIGYDVVEMLKKIVAEEIWLWLQQWFYFLFN
jgi:hypothetical protein